MKNISASPRILILLSAFIFYLLFFDHWMGINAVLLTAYTWCLFFLVRRKSPGRIFYLLLSGTGISSLAVVFAHTDFSFVIFWCCLVLLLGNFAYQEIRHLQYGMLQALLSIKKIPATLLVHSKFMKKRTGINYWAYMRFTVLPFLTLLVIFILYSFASDEFYLSFETLANRIGDLLSQVSFPRLFFFLLGVVVFALGFVQINSSRWISEDQALQLNLVRKRKKSLLTSLNRLLLRKKQIAVTLFTLLNLMILWLNYLDITHIWFGFHWDGGYLKGMVHEGTYLLIAAILISIVISVYYLNSNISFFRNNKLFHTLVIAWLCQNVIMIVSVVLRNTYYIDYFALAYKRIFVYFFLAACVIGLFSIVYMIWKRKSFGFLLSVNSVSVFVLVLISGCFNWDAIIARYNFGHYKESFVHYNFLAGLNNSALPFMNYTDEQLKQINTVQYKRFSFASSDYYTHSDFHEEINLRKQAFQKNWEHHSWLEWNYPEQKAYDLLFKKN